MRTSILGSAAVTAFCILVLSAHVVMPAETAPNCAFCRGSDAGMPILNVAHAGASSLAPQNTMASGRAALAAGADVWGIDVRRTLDGVFVLMHDETLDRTTNVETVFPARAPWKVSEFRLDEIQTLDAGSWFVQEDPFDQIAQGNVSAAEAASYIGEPVPTLREALEFVASNDWLMDIEVKAPINTDFETAAVELQALIRETGTQDRVMVSSFDLDVLRAVRRVAPEIPIGVLVILPPLNAIEMLESLGADVYLPSVVGFTDALLADLEEAGIRVIVWTYDSVDQLKFASGLLGVDGIYTDFPQRLASLLAETSP